MNNPKISVIVPIYNAQPHLRKCLESIRVQTYRNLEILLVDDGSTDGGRAVCEEYIGRDTRFRLIAQKNRGVSAARNAGLRAATGQWIGWTDPDDYIDPDMFSCLLRNALEQDADICICGWFHEQGTSITQLSWPVFQKMDQHQALEALIKDDAMPSFLWNKLWKREILLDLQFPENVIYEDVFFCWCAYLQAGCIVCLPEAKYHYVRHPKSLSGEWNIPKLLDFYRAAKDRYEGLIGAYPQHRNLLERDPIRLAFLIGELCFRSDAAARKENRRTLQEMAAFALSRKDKQNYDNVPARVKLLLRLYSLRCGLTFMTGECLIRIYTQKAKRKRSL